jgi:hypothetical protein
MKRSWSLIRKSFQKKTTENGGVQKRGGYLQILREEKMCLLSLCKYVWSTPHLAFQLQTC